ncbi:hypothetical protein C8R43DRAFT_1132339 [Mycena crocata]|nr:hypothetical protein C8R43DRAFT_1132339 [Mycena crocata]
MAARRHPREFIDDVAQDDDAFSSDNDEVDPDSMEGQAMALDQRDYNMPEALAAHESSLRNPAPYRMPARAFPPQNPEPRPRSPSPVAGPSNYRTRPCSRSPPPGSATPSSATPSWKPPSWSLPQPPRYPASRAPTPYASWNPPPMAYAPSTPYFPAAPSPAWQPAPSPAWHQHHVSQAPLFLPESRDATPYDAPDPRDLTPFEALVYQPGVPFRTAHPSQPPSVPRPLKRRRTPSPEEEQQEEFSPAQSSREKHRRVEPEEEEEEEIIPVPLSDSDESDEDEELVSTRKPSMNVSQFVDVAAEESDDAEDADSGSEGNLEETQEDRDFIDNTEPEVQDEQPRPVPTNFIAEVADAEQEAAALEDRAGAYRADLIFEQRRENVADLTHPDFVKLDPNWRDIRRYKTFPYRPLPVPRFQEEFKPRYVRGGDWLKHRRGLAFATSDTELLLPHLLPPSSPAPKRNPPPEEGLTLAHRQRQTQREERRQERAEKQKLARAEKMAEQEEEADANARQLEREDLQFPEAERKRRREQRNEATQRRKDQKQKVRQEKRDKRAKNVEEEELREEYEVAKTTTALILKSGKPRRLHHPVLPTIDDLLPFQPLRRVTQFFELGQPATVPGTAIAEGDLVVMRGTLPNGDRKQKPVTVLKILEEKNGELPRVKVSRHVHLMEPMLKATTEDLSPEKMLARKGAELPLHDLIRHPLDPPPPLRVGDRVRVVQHPVDSVKGTVGRVLDLKSHPTLFEDVTIQTANWNRERKDFETLQSTVDSLHRIFLTGDEIDIIRGTHAGKCGLVLEVLWGGSILRLFVDGQSRADTDDRYCTVRSKDCNLNWTNFRAPASWSRPGELKPNANQPRPSPPPSAQQAPMSPLQAKIQQLDREYQEFRARSELQVTLQGELIGSLAPSGLPQSELERKLTELRVNLALVSDQKREEDMKRQMNTGKRFENRRVVIFKGNHKGISGQVKGDFDSPERRARKPAPGDMEGIRFSIQPDESHQSQQLVENVPIENCMYAGTLIVISKSVVLTAEQLASRDPWLDYTTRRPRDPTPPPSPPPPPPEQSHAEDLWASGSRPEAAVPPWPESLPGENDGSWLCKPELQQKRLDVRIQGTQQSTNKISAKGLRLEGGVGYIVMTQPVPVSKISRATLMVYAINGNNVPISYPVQCIRPLRFGPDPARRNTPQSLRLAITPDDSAASLAGITERVVIVGPDTTGDDKFSGEIAQTMPEGPSVGENVVRVKFKGLHFGTVRNYHISSLCCSRNIQTDVPIVLLTTQFY